MIDRVVIVGNGPSALDGKHGPFIDESRHVVRFNNFVTRGFEDSIGERTTIWAHSASCVRPRKVAQFEEVIYCIPAHPVAGARRIAWNEVGKLTTSAKVRGTIIPENVHRELKRWLRRRPSAGVMVIQFMLDTRRFPLPLHLIGFDHWKEKREHYWDDRKINQWVHHPEDEARYVECKMKEGGVRI